MEGNNAYRILKIPVNREKAVFYYYKKFEQSDSKALVDVPAERSVYLCHFLRPIEEEFIQKYFGKVGKIKQIMIGEYKNKACNKRKRRTIYYAIVVFKLASDCQRILSDSKLVQSIVNSVTKK